MTPPTRRSRRRKPVWMKVKNGETLRRWRKRKDYSQRDLAALVKCAQNTISLLETGQMITLSEDLAMQIARRLDVPWEELFEARESPGVRRLATGASSRGRDVA